MTKHKVFISFHHADRNERAAFIFNFGSAFLDFSVRDKDIPDGLSTETVRQKIRDEYIRDSSVTIVLIGQETWKRKHVDWEIDSSLRHTQFNPRTGLLGILLPSYRPLQSWQLPLRPEVWSGLPRFTPSNIPPRLWDNVGVGFATIRQWPQNTWELEGWVEQAFQRRHKEPPPNLSYPRFGANRSPEANGWTR